MMLMMVKTLLVMVTVWMMMMMLLKMWMMMMILTTLHRYPSMPLHNTAYNTVAERAFDKTSHAEVPRLTPPGRKF